MDVLDFSIRYDVFLNSEVILIDRVVYAATAFFGGAHLQSKYFGNRRQTFGCGLVNHLKFIYFLVLLEPQINCG